MTPNRPNLNPAYVLATVAVFCGVAIVLALIGQYVDITPPARNLIAVAVFGLLAAMIAVLTVAVTAVQIVFRQPSHARDLAEIREQLQHVGSMLREREPHEEEDRSAELHANVSRLQQATAQSQQDLAQLQEMLRQVMGKLDSLRSVATTPSPAAAALDREADDSGIFPAVNEDDTDGEPAASAAHAARKPASRPIALAGRSDLTDRPTAAHTNNSAADAAEDEADEAIAGDLAAAPAFNFRPTPPPDETPVEQYDSLDKVRARVDDLMALSNWDTALLIAEQYANQNAEDSDAQWLRQRVQREYDIYREGSVRRLYEQIKDELDRKHYRRALSIARRLLDKFADHKKAQKIRQQLPTILENAEIEERQEDEARIQSYIKAKRFQDAVELGEALLAKYPMSPQAESLDNMLPRLRELAIEQEAESIGRR